MGERELSPEPHRNHSRIFFFLQDYLANESCLRVLDQGCGLGHEMINLRHALPDSRLVGLEISLAKVLAAREHVDNRDRQLDLFVAGDGAHLPFASGTFDVIISVQVIEHLEAQAWYVQEACRLLRPGGVYFLSTVNRLSPWEGHVSLPLIPWMPKRASAAYLNWRYRDWRRDYYKTIYLLTALQVEGLLKRAGFSRVQYASLKMLDDVMIETVRLGRRRTLLSTASQYLRFLLALPIIGPCLKTMLRIGFPYVAFTCIK